MNQVPAADNTTANQRIRQAAWIMLLVVILFLAGLAVGYLKWARAEKIKSEELSALYEQVNPKEGYALPISYGSLGPRLIGAGVINYAAFANVMSSNGRPLTQSQMDMLHKGSEEQVVITAENAHFLLNFFWAVGLANKNSILTKGPMVQNSDGDVGQFASTGGWTLAAKPVAEIYASLDLIPLAPEQQAQVEEVAAAVYRPCCNNATLFPDCNHGMAMLGLLELMASQGATTDQMFEAAKYVNAFWFPQQTLETAIYLKSTENVDFVDADAHLVVGKDLSSGSGANLVHQSLQQSGLLKQAAGPGGSCSN